MYYSEVYANKMHNVILEKLLPLIYTLYMVQYITQVAKFYN